MEKIVSILKSKILRYTIFYVIFLIASKIFFNALGLEYMQYIYQFSVAIIIIGIIAGFIQVACINQSKAVRISIASFMIFLVIVGAIFSQIILLFYIAYFPPEHIVKKENKKMVGYVYGFLRTRVDYYEYVNFFLRKKNIVFSEDYGKGGFDPIKDPSIRGVQSRTYYDKQGKIQKEDDIEELISQNEQEENTEEVHSINVENGYEIFFNENEGCRIDIVDYAMGKEAIKVYATKDGKNWSSQLETEDGGMWVHYHSKFLFINPLVGFIYDPGRDGDPEDNAILKVTTNGGKSYQECNIIHPQNITEKNLLIKDLPVYEEDRLKLTVYTLNYNKDPKRTYYEFISDDGINWKYNNRQNKENNGL